MANHPHGMVDGMIFADMIGRVRLDYRILTRSVLTGLDEAATSFMIPVPFPHDPEAQAKMVEMRAKAMAHLKDGGVVALFPSGVVMSSDTWFGPAIEREWSLFTAKMIRRSGARVVPIFYPGLQFALVSDRQPDFPDPAAGAFAARNCTLLQQTAGPCHRRAPERRTDGDAGNRSARLYGVAARAHAGAGQQGLIAGV